MNEAVRIVAGLVALNGGEVVGKVRLQKTFHLLDACGLGSGFDYDFHFYGPFSAELSRAADDAIELGLIAHEDRRGHHGVPYRVFRTAGNASPPDGLGALPAPEIRRKLAIMARYSAAELEVAATVVFLRENGYRDDPIGETRRRKPSTATAERIARAGQLIHELGL